MFTLLNWFCYRVYLTNQPYYRINSRFMNSVARGQLLKAHNWIRNRCIFADVILTLFITLLITFLCH